MPWPDTWFLQSRRDPEEDPVHHGRSLIAHALSPPSVRAAACFGPAYEIYRIVAKVKWHLPGNRDPLRLPVSRRRTDRQS